jgi:chromosomal replication initiator protein
LTFLGENLRSNIRQIEGAIKKLGALTFLSGRQINMELAHDCITELLGGAEPVSVTVDKIFQHVGNKFNVSKEDLCGPKRNKDIAAARHFCIFLIREMTEMSYPNIAKLFNRDHATIMTSYNNTFTRYQLDPMFEMEVNNSKKELTD